LNRAAFPTPAGNWTRIKEQALDWAFARSGAFVFLDSCGYEDRYGEWEWLLASGERNSVSDLNEVATRRWLFGHILYDEPLDTEHECYVHKEDGRGYGRTHFFEPEVIVGMRPGAETVAVFADSPQDVWAEVIATPISALKPLPSVRFSPAMDRSSYVETVEALREHIAAGDCYEINLCNERRADEEVQVDALSAYRRLRDASPAPFGAFLRQDGVYTLSASPERFLCGWESRIISQPMKGTTRRGRTELEDAEMIANLHSSAKERAENVMIVDLVRSDLARSCVPGSVSVDELFGIQSFPAVHQMVSTVSGRLRDDLTSWDAIGSAFPMGSMTGAPKEMVMRLIRRYEGRPRGRFSGSIGYMTPDGDFDLAVVIRSIFYDERSGALWYNTGGAITWDSDAASEWEETLLKGAVIEQLFR
jgi:para-aminobenzoate synthetase component 1